MVTVSVSVPLNNSVYSLPVETLVRGGCISSVVSHVLVVHVVMTHVSMMPVDVDPVCHIPGCGVVGTMEHPASRRIAQMV
jgi:hypothetical protein